MPQQILDLDNRTTSVFIGITGLLATGKGTVIKLITDLTPPSVIRVLSFSLSDELRSVITNYMVGGEKQILLSNSLVERLKEDWSNGKVLRRENQIDTANELRKNYGTGVLAQRIIPKILREVLTESHPYNLVIIDSIRNPGEVLEFRARWGERFKLIAVEASEVLADNRIVKRRRDDESEAALDNQEALIKLRQQDSGEGEPPYGLQVEACQRMADWHIFNDGSIEELNNTIYHFLNQDVMPLLGLRGYAAQFQ